MSTTCPRCQMPVKNGTCTNPDGCYYRGPGETAAERAARWASQHPGEFDRTSGGNAYGHYEE